MPEAEEYDGKTLIYWLSHIREIEREKLIRLTKMYHLLSARTENSHSPVHRYLYALSEECYRRGIPFEAPKPSL